MKQQTPWLVCVFVPFIVVDLQLAIYCDAPGYKVRTYDTEELFYDQKKQHSPRLISDGTIRRRKLIWSIVPYFGFRYKMPISAVARVQNMNLKTLIFIEGKGK